jgi:hypothetical protein
MSAGERAKLIDGWKRAVDATLHWARITKSPEEIF